MKYLFLILSFTLISAPTFSQEKDSIYTIVDEMPRFPGCEGIEVTADKKRSCANRKMLEYFYEKIVFPKNIMSDTIHQYDNLLLSFIVEKDGCLNDIKFVQGSTKLVNNTYTKLMFEAPRWTPGKHHGEPVAVRVNLPIRLQLNF